MRFIISATTFLKSLQAISGVLTTNSALPILDNFLIESDGEMLKVTASDQETTMVVSVKPEIISDKGRIVVPAKVLIEWLKTLSDIPVTFVVNENYSVHISSGEGEYNLSGYNPDEYPQLPTIDNVTSFVVDSNILETAISKTLYATGNDEMRPAMAGVLCEAKEDRIIFVATDAHKLVRYARMDAHSENEISFIFPKKPLNLLKNVIGASKAETVQINYTDKHVVFVFGNFTLTCLQIIGKFPNYSAVIPTDNPNVLLIDRSQLINTLQRISIFANQSTHQVRLKLAGQELAIVAEDIDYSNDGYERLTCNYSGEDMDIGFNAKSLIEMLNNIDSEIARIELSQPNRAGLIFPNEPSSSDEDILMLIMPIMLNS
ncbi:MAG: DNA polymerase III subunit beta [Bacteroidales bacterium]|jgi:DNA polymerase-3 subunit beta|nr:DNA polymerase III subunit beta [Bacteroidales bacterium]